MSHLFKSRYRASFFLNEMWKWPVRDTHFYSAEILNNSVPFQPWNLFWVHWNWASCFGVSNCLHLHYIKMCPAKKHAENVFLFSLIVLTTVCFSDLQCWGTLQVFCMGYELVGITAGDISAACWGKRRSLTLPRYVVWPFMLFMCGGTFFMLVSLKYTDLEEWHNLTFHYLYILSSPLFPVQCH